MPPKKKAVPPIYGDGFKGKEELNLDDIKKCAVEGFSKDNLKHLTPDWSGEVAGVVGLSLSNDNKRVTEGRFYLIGNLCTDKRSHANKFWNISEPLTLTVTIPDCSIFKFSSGGLVSELLDGGTIKHSFYKGEDLVPAESLPDNILGFTLRAHIIPTTSNWAKLYIILFPLPIDLLKSTHPLCANPMFPGILVFSGEFPLIPSSSALPLKKNWGCPITPAILPGAFFSESENFPKTNLLRAAIAQLLRKAVKPEGKAGFDNLIPRWLEIFENGISKLRNTTLDSIWPAPSSRNEDFSEGRVIILVIYRLLYIPTVLEIQIFHTSTP